MTGLVAAAVALPIVLHNTRSEVGNGSRTTRRQQGVAMFEAMKKLRSCAMAIAVLGLVIPTHVLGDETTPTKKRPRVHDIQLDDQGDLHVVVVNAEGQSMREHRVQLTGGGTPNPSVGMTDQDGRHTFRGLTGGVYQLQTDQGVCVCRVWTTSAAPPSAAKSLLIVNDVRVTRGQRPIREMFRSDPLLMTAIVAAAIAIPIAIHQSRDKSSGS